MIYDLVVCITKVIVLLQEFEQFFSSLAFSLEEANSNFSDEKLA